MTSRSIALVSHLAGLVTAVGCGEPPPGTGPGAPPTYYPTIQKLVADNCVDCHKEGGIAPFPLQTYDDVKGLGTLFHEVTRSRQMPPNNIDASGDCGTFLDVKWLDDAELDQIQAFVEAGFPEGDPAQAAAPAQQQAALTEVGAVLDMGETYAPPEAVVDDYRCFLVDPGLQADKLMTAYRVNPGDRRVVHHVIVYVPADEGAEAAAVALDEAEAGPGYTCFGAAGVEAGLLIGWAPGTDVTRLPEGTGLRVPAGRKLVMQVHYNVATGSHPDRTTVDLELEDSVPEEAMMLLDGDGSMVLQPGLPDATWSYGFEVEASVRLRGLFPHMHERGTTMRIEVTDPQGERACLIDVPRWDFHWQRFWFYERFVGIEYGSRIDITCTYDTTGDTDEVRFGEGTGDEMCVVGYYLTLQ